MLNPAVRPLSPEISVLTLSWINIQLRAELARREAEESERSTSYPWFARRQAAAAVSGLIAGFFLVLAHFTA